MRTKKLGFVDEAIGTVMAFSVTVLMLILEWFRK